MDARPSINAFNLLLEYMSSPDPLDASSLPWGTEWIHLPDGPIASTGGPRSEVEWGNEGNALFAKITNLYENPMVRYVNTPESSSAPPHISQNSPHIACIAILQVYLPLDTLVDS